MTAIVNNVAGGSLLEDIDKVLYDICDRTTPFLSRALDLSNPVESYKHEWVEDTLVGFADTFKSALSSTTTTTITVSSTTSNPKRYIAGLSLLRVAGSDEIMLVSSVITTTTTYTSLNVTRGSRSTTPSTYAVGDEILIISNHQTEGFDASRDDSQQGARLFNYTQIFSRELKLSGSYQAVNTVGMESKMKKQAERLIKEIMKEMELAAIHGLRYADADLDDRDMGGLRYWVNSVGNEVDFGGNTINFNMFDTVIEDYITNGGDPMKLCVLVHPRQQRLINDLKEARIIGGGQKQSEMRVNNFVTRYDFGSDASVEIIMSNDVFRDEIYFFEKGRVKVKPLKGRKLKKTPLGKTGDNDKQLLVGEYTLQCTNARELLFRYHNLSKAV